MIKIFMFFIGFIMSAYAVRDIYLCVRDIYLWVRNKNQREIFNLSRTFVNPIARFNRYVGDGFNIVASDIEDMDEKYLFRVMVLKKDERIISEHNENWFFDGKSYFFLVFNQPGNIASLGKYKEIVYQCLFLYVKITKFEKGVKSEFYEKWIFDDVDKFLKIFPEAFCFVFNRETIDS